MWFTDDIKSYKFSSNSKELSTLKVTLECLLAEDPDSICNTTVFYFTDNSAVYWIASSGSSASEPLHALIESIRIYELRLGCHLQVVHVPGLLMIRQGTDGLSRGIWMSALQGLIDTRRLTQAVFDPLPFDPYLVQEYVNLLPAMHHQSRAWVYCDWS